MERDSLITIASGARSFLKTVWPEWQLESARRHGSALPEILSSSTCGRSSTFVQEVIAEFGFAAEVIHGRFGPSEDRHAWVACGPWLIDSLAELPVLATRHYAVCLSSVPRLSSDKP